MIKGFFVNFRQIQTLENRIDKFLTVRDVSIFDWKTTWYKSGETAENEKTTEEQKLDFVANSQQTGKLKWGVAKW